MALFTTVAAISTAEGKGGIGVVRISGPDAFAVADRVFQPMQGGGFAEMAGYTAKLGHVTDKNGKRLDQCIGLCFRAPRSYTGEDVAELQCHGGEAVTQAVLRAVLDAGAEPAGRGEFTRRAYLSGRISLTEAEAVMDIISASSLQGQRAAVNLADGALAKEADALRGEILKIQTQIAAEIDFPEEDVEEADRSEIEAGVSELAQRLGKLISGYDAGQKLLRGVPAAIVGSPNVGKSTLLNRIAGYEKAIVSGEAGTTRDVLEEQVTLGGVSLILADTAGIRAEAGGEIERIGIGLARKKLEQSSLILAVFDASRPLNDDDRALMADLAGRPVLAVINKCDLADAGSAAEVEAAFPRCVRLSAKEPSALDTLSAAVAEFLGTAHFDADAPLLANERQRGCAVRAADAVGEASASLFAGETLDVCYALLDEALGALYELSGEDASEEVIDAVFREFCVGK